MSFNFEQWKETTKQKLKGWKGRMKKAGVQSVYYFLAGVSLVPVAQAVHSGDWSGLAVLGATVGTAVSTNLLANMVQKFKDKSDAEVAEILEAEVQTTPELKTELDALLEKLETLPAAESVLSKADKVWFEETIQNELENLGSQIEYSATLIGDGAIAQGKGAKAVGKGGMLIEGDVQGDVIRKGGKKEIHYHTAAPKDKKALRLAYLNHVFENTSQLHLSGIDPKTASDAEARLNLSAVYTALLTLSSDDQEALQGKLPRDLERLAGSLEKRRASALEQLNRHAHLVLLGDPGSGKSTFVNFVAMCLAGNALGHKDANLKTLTAPLPIEEKERLRSNDEKPKPQPWKHGELLPVRIILRDFAARGLPPIGQKASAKSLWDFIVGELNSHALGEFAKPLDKELREKGGLILLDGLDEVPEADQRRAQIKQALEDFAASFHKCSILITSRTYAYQKQDWRLNGFSESVLAPFSDGQIRNFVEHWYTHIGILRRMDAEDAKGRAEILKRAIFNSERLKELAERPLLLTLMASLHAWRGGTLPEKREELYADAVNLLLDWWESPKAVRDGRGELVFFQPSLAEWLKVDRQKVRSLLEELAFEAHRSQPELTGTADISEGDLVSGLMRLSQNPAVNPRQLVEYLSLRAGLLISRGVGVYTFPHRTFQEYLAACYLTDHDYPDRIAELACQDFNRWREVALLSGAKAVRGTSSAIWSLVDALCYNDASENANDKHLWGAHLAGLALTESGDSNRVSERNRGKLERVRNWQLTILGTDHLPAIARAEAGRTLSKLGDPRPAVMTCAHMMFCHVPAGKFIYGEDKEKKEIKLDEFWVGKYPITNAQFEQFVQAEGYDNKDFWQEAIKEKYWSKGGFKGRWDDAPRKSPHDYGEPFTFPNHPVVGITWYEALAFTRWLNSLLFDISQQWTVTGGERNFREQMKIKKILVALPTEEQWEKSARGTDGREYPWLGEFDPNKANTSETGIGTTSAVGCFPAGQNSYGLLDASGNVLEWTGNGNYLRGGSFYDLSGFARCSFRGRSFPVSRYGYRGFRVVVSPVLLS